MRKAVKMASFLTFVRGTEYTFNIYNRIFAEHPCILTSTDVGKTYGNIITTGVTYHYVNSDGETYTGSVNYDSDTGDIYTGVAYSSSSELLDIIQITFTPEAGTPNTIYIHSGKSLLMGKTLYITDVLGTILNTQQFFYLLGIGHDPEVENYSYSDTFIDFYIKQVIPASVEAKTYTIT